MPESWLEELDEYRNAKDEFFRSHHDSPISKDLKKRFSGLKYFPPDPEYKVRGTINRFEKPERIEMATNTGTMQKFDKIGYIELEVKGRAVKLFAYRAAESTEPELFVPFRDATSGKETYGAARYLDVEDAGTSEITIDFNFAYNPYCAYSDDFVCPLAPAENWLSIEIRAGEKTYH